MTAPIATPGSRAPHTVEFEQITDARFGGKAAGLAELRRLGLDVPPGFVIADASADLVVVDNSPTDNAARWYQRMADAGATPVAVRSSAAGEDGVDQSFAGQYDTVLGVDSAEGFAAAVRTCVDSVDSRRAASYRAVSDHHPEPDHPTPDHTTPDRPTPDHATPDYPTLDGAGPTGAAAPDVPMHLVVQQMVDARAAGVVFTADPASGRRDLMVIDAVPGLGEALVDGTASPEHIVLDSRGDVAVHEAAVHTVAVHDSDDDEVVLSPEEIAAIRSGGLAAARHWGRPMDLEWAIDRSGRLWWLQARPITTLPGDLGEMDSTLAGADHVYTRCNIGEMMPGAFCPLTASVSGFAIDYAMQKIQVVARAQPSYEQPWLQVGYFSGHMFLNLTEGTALSSGLVGNSLEQFSTSICGRVVDELVPKPPKPFLRRLSNTIRLSTHALSAGPAIRRLGDQIAGWRIPTSDDPRLVLAQLETGVEQYCDVTLTHVRSSSRAAVAANILESVLIKQAVRSGRSEDSGRTDAARLMAGASDVESALMLEELDAVVRAIAADTGTSDPGTSNSGTSNPGTSNTGTSNTAGGEFLAAEPGDAVLAVLASSSATGVALRRFLARHGHRGYRELCMRDPSWAEDPEGLGAMMQVMVRSARVSPDRGPVSQHVDEPGSPAIRLLARFAQEGARGREETKSKMARMAHALKLGYRHLGAVLARAGRLPDADLVFFFDRAELDVVAGSGDISELVTRALKRREALAFQDSLEFEDVAVGRPEPIIARARGETAGETADEAAGGAAGGEIIGRPASRGTVEGVVRVARSIVDAREVQRGEILVAPVTDVGWTPYFTVIAALVTDIGSSVSHGAVVAREYGLPCVVNTLVATQTLRTGERVRVDGDRGVVTRLDPR